MQALEAIEESCFKDGKRKKKSRLPLFEMLRDPGGWKRVCDMEEKVDWASWSFDAEGALSGAGATWWVGLTAESQMILRPRGRLGNSSKAWNLVPQDTNSYRNIHAHCFTFSLLVRKKERPKTWNASHFWRSRLGIRSQFDKDFLWESGEGKSFSLVNPSIARELDPEFLNIKMVPSLEWGLSIYSRSQSILSKSSIRCKLLSAKQGIIYWLILRRAKVTQG